MTSFNPELVNRIEHAVCSAAQHLLLSIQRGRDLQTSRKADSTIVTVLDVESQEILRDHLRGLLPIVTEEDPTTHSLVSENDFILIDPLDGTTACRRFSELPAGQVGFGPLVGVAHAGRLWAAVYANIPTGMLYTAVQGQGVYAISLAQWSRNRTLNQRTRLLRPEHIEASHSAALFYPGDQGEIVAVQRLKTQLGLETMYRFGGFANDCTRVAQGLEQLVIQFSLKAWDLSAALLASEAGYAVVVNPFDAAVELAEYRIEPRCKVLILPGEFKQKALAALRA